jgi:hypothetical protein
MKRETFRIDPGRAGVLHTTIVPETKKQHARLTVLKVLLGSTLLIAAAALARLLRSH